MNNVANFPGLPSLDLDVLGLQLELLWRRGFDAGMKHDEALKDKGVPRDHPYRYFYVMDADMKRESPMSVEMDDGDLYWSGTDRDGDHISLSVPQAVLCEQETVEEWAERTYARYLKSEEERKRREHEKWLATKDRRRQEYERLKAEFEDAGQEAGDASSEGSSLRLP